MIFFGIENIVFLDISNWPSCDIESFLSMYRNDFLNASNRKCSIYWTIFSINRIKNVWYIESIFRYIETIFCRFIDFSIYQIDFLSIYRFFDISNRFFLFSLQFVARRDKKSRLIIVFFCFLQWKVRKFRWWNFFFFIKMWLEDGIFYLEILE